MANNEEEFDKMVENETTNIDEELIEVMVYSSFGSPMSKGQLQFDRSCSLNILKI